MHAFSANYLDTWEAFFNELSKVRRLLFVVCYVTALYVSDVWTSMIVRIFFPRSDHVNFKRKSNVPSFVSLILNPQATIPNYSLFYIGPIFGFNLILASIAHVIVL